MLWLLLSEGLSGYIIYILVYKLVNIGHGCEETMNPVCLDLRYSSIRRPEGKCSTPRTNDNHAPQPCSLNLGHHTQTPRPTAQSSLPLPFPFPHRTYRLPPPASVFPSSSLRPFH